MYVIKRMPRGARGMTNFCVDLPSRLTKNRGDIVLSRRPFPRSARRGVGRMALCIRKRGARTTKIVDTDLRASKGRYGISRVPMLVLSGRSCTSTLSGVCRKAGG